MDLQTVFAERRSVRKYSSAPSHEELTEILNAARMAPSWKNSQTTRWYVVEDPEKLEEIRLALHAINQQKVADIKKAVMDGSYTIDSVTIANKMVDFEQELDFLYN